MSANGSRSRNVKTSPSRMVTFGSPARSSVRSGKGSTLRSFSFMAPAPRIESTILPFARFLIRRGVAVLGYDKRGVGGSTGDWNTASFDDLAGDAVAAFEYLKTRSDIDRAQIGLLGVSQAGWIMPLAAVRAKDFGFLISISGAGVPGLKPPSIRRERNDRQRHAVRGRRTDRRPDEAAVSIRANGPGVG